MTKICLIKPNSLYYSLMDNNNIEKMTKDKFEEDIEDFVLVQNVSDNNDLIDKLLSIANNDKEVMIYTTTIYENYDYVYQMCHLSTYSDVKELESINKKIVSFKQNGIANILCDNLYKVYGNSIILKYKINSDNTLTHVDLDFSGFLNLFLKKKINLGVVIHQDGEIKEMEYIGNPLNQFNNDKLPNFRYYEKEIMGKVFMFFIEVKPFNDKINKIASLIWGSSIKGDVILSVRNKIDDIQVSEPVYFNITSDLIFKLKKLMEDENFSIEQEPYYSDNKNKKYQGFYNLINKLYDDIDPKKIKKKQMNYEGKSLNELTENLIAKK